MIMKQNSFFVLTVVLLLFFLLSCSDKNDDSVKNEEERSQNEKINSWIYDEMNFQYYWNDAIPDKAKLDFDVEPVSFFSKLIYKHNTLTGDRFSYMEKNDVPYFPTTKSISASTHTKHNDIGFNFLAYGFVNNSVVLFVNYIKPDSNTDKQTDGLKRGDLISKIDGISLNKDNYLGLIHSGKSSLYLEFENNRSPLKLEATPVYTENPILLEKIINFEGKKIGYIVYNFFANDDGDNSYEYAVRLNDIFEEYEKKKIDELILDLRYNGGGYVESGTYIASAIVPNRNAPDVKIYTQRAYNKVFDAYLQKQDNYAALTHEYFADYIGRNNVNKGSIARLNMKRLYVLTSERTASASEQIINGLGGGQYVDVQLIGETTTGKNMESFEIKDKKNPNNTWVLHPLTSISYNSKAKTPEDNLYYGGFKPTYGGEVNEAATIIGNTLYFDSFVYPLGDTREKLLALALNSIAGKPASVSRSMRSAIQKGRTLSGERLESSSDFNPKGMIIDIKNKAI